MLFRTEFADGDELKGGQAICYQCLRRRLDDPPPQGLARATHVDEDEACAWCGDPMEASAPVDPSDCEHLWLPAGPDRSICPHCEAVKADLAEDSAD